MIINPFIKFLRQLKTSEFSRNVITLMTGTALSQAIPLALSPILTRLYSPNDFGILAIYIALTTVLTVFVSFKYELAIVIPADDKSAAHITTLSILIAIGISIICLIAVLLFNDDIATLITDKEQNARDLSKWLYFVPVTILFTGVFNALNYWFNRSSKYRNMAKGKVVNSSGAVGVQVGMGAISLAPVGLLIGLVAGRVMAAAYMINRFFKDPTDHFRPISISAIRKVMHRYKRFPQFAMPAEAINVISNQLPVIVIGKYFGGITLGNYALMERIINAPISLLGRSVLDVFKQKASEDFVNKGNCKAIFLKTLKTLSILAILPTLGLFLLAPLAFGIIFGDEWVLAGEFARIMSVLFFFKFIASPLSYMFNIAEKQHIDLYWQLALFLATVLAFFIGVKMDNVKIGLICFVIFYSLLYLINLYLSYQFSKGNKR